MIKDTKAMMTEMPRNWTPKTKVEPPFMKEWQARKERQVRLYNWIIKSSQESYFLIGKTAPRTEVCEGGTWGRGRTFEDRLLVREREGIRR